jgi:hypothetical protein
MAIGIIALLFSAVCEIVKTWVPIIFGALFIFWLSINKVARPKVVESAHA